jgi:hypothetical protein
MQMQHHVVDGPVLERRLALPVGLSQRFEQAAQLLALGMKVGDFLQHGQFSLANSE